MSELLPCPFCGGEARVYEDGDGDWHVYCRDGFYYGCLGYWTIDRFYPTRAEAIAAWNTRAPIEYDGWFYLPKPKEGIVDYGEPEITRTENGYKVRQIVDVVDEAARKWGDELGDYVMKRICEAWNTRAERTCHRVLDSELASKPGWHIKHRCSECGEKLNSVNYCPNCGARVVS